MVQQVRAHQGSAGRMPRVAGAAAAFRLPGMTRDDPLRAAIAMLVAVALFALMDAGLKLLSPHCRARPRTRCCAIGCRRSSISATTTRPPLPRSRS